MDATAQKHMAAIVAGRVEKTNIIGIRKAINAIEREGTGARRSMTAPRASVDDVFDIEQAIAEREPLVVGELFMSGLKVLENPRYAKRWTDAERAIIEDLDTIRLVRFDRVGRGYYHSVPVYRAKGRNGDSFLYRNIPWQTAWTLNLPDGPRIVEDE